MTKGNPSPTPPRSGEGLNLAPPSFLGKGAGGLGSCAAARIPLTHLDALGPVRNVAGVRVHATGETAWVCWPSGRADVVRCLLPVPGVMLFQRREGEWFKFGNRLPSSEVPPETDGVPLTAMLVPAKFGAAAPPTAALVTRVVGVQRGGEPKPATALVCSLAELLKWADVATTAELAAVHAARSGERAVLLGSRLPSIPGAVRFWGKDVLVPVGFHPDPELTEATLRQACGVVEGELLLLGEAGAEVIPCRVFHALSRSGVRLSVQNA